MITKDIKVIPGLCIHCSACSEVCPTGAIRLGRTLHWMPTPEIDHNKCSRCMLCHRICPVEIEQTTEYLKKYQNSYDGILGKYLSCFDMVSNDTNLRHAASSAGVVRSIIKHVISSQSVQAALCVCENPANVLDPCFVLMHSLADCQLIANSKYGPVRFAGALKELLNNTSIKDVIITGLPCHIRAIKKIAKYDKRARGKNIVTVSLFCKKTKDIRYTKYLIRRLRRRELPLEDLEGIQYRGSGWPGKVRMSAGNIVHEAPFYRPDVANHPWQWYIFSPNSCLFCYDAFGREADISVGDPWLKSYLENDRYALGASLVVARTEAGLHLLETMTTLIKRPVSPAEVIRSQSRKAIIEKTYFAAGIHRVLSLFSSGYRLLLPQQNRGMAAAVWFLFWKHLFEFILDSSLANRIPTVMFRIAAHLPLFPQKRY